MTTKEFIMYASERPELCEKLSACTAPEEAYALAEKEGLTDDLAAFTAVMTAAKKEAEKLNDTDLNSVTAAGTTTAVMTVTLSTAASATGAAAATVAAF